MTDTEKTAHEEVVREKGNAIQTRKELRELGIEGRYSQGVSRSAEVDKSAHIAQNTVVGPGAPAATGISQPLAVC